MECVRYFESLHILHLMPGAFRTAATVGLGGSWGLFELKVHKPVKGFVTLHQKRYGTHSHTAECSV